MKFLQFILLVLTLSSSYLVLGQKQNLNLHLYCSKDGSQFETSDGIFGCTGSAVENVHYNIEDGYVTNVICDALEYNGVVCSLKNGLKDGTKKQNTKNIVLKNGETEDVPYYCTEDNTQIETYDGVFGCAGKHREISVSYEIVNNYVINVTCGEFKFTGAVCSLKHGLKDGTQDQEQQQDDTVSASLLQISSIIFVIIIGFLV